MDKYNGMYMKLSFIYKKNNDLICIILSLEIISHIYRADCVNEIQKKKSITLPKAWKGVSYFYETSQS